MERPQARTVSTSAIDAIVLLLAVGLFACGFFLEDRGVGDAPSLRLATMSVDDLLRLRPKPGEATIHIDSIETQRRSDIPVSADESTIALPANVAARFVGWTIDASARRPAKAVFISVDSEEPTACSYGFDRPDVAVAYGDDAFTASGLRCDVAGSSLRPGRHHITFDFVNAAGTAYDPVVSPHTFIASATGS